MKPAIPLMNPWDTGMKGCGKDLTVLRRAGENLIRIFLQIFYFCLTSPAGHCGWISTNECLRSIGRNVDAGLEPLRNAIDNGKARKQNTGVDDAKELAALNQFST
jgi:hypothetical protein